MPNLASLNPTPAGRETLKDIRLRYTHSHSIFNRKFDKAMAKLKLSAGQRILMSEIAGTQEDKANLLASNRLGREAYASGLEKLMVSEFRSHPDQQYHLATIFSDHFNSTNITTYIDLEDIERRARKIINGMGVDAAIGMIEFQPQGRDEGNGVRTLYPNVHLIVRAPLGFKPKVMSKGLSSRFGLKSKMGAAPVHISNRIRTVEDMARIVRYMSKFPCTGKLLVRTKRGDRFRDTASGINQNTALRMTEILSHFTLTELTIASGIWTGLRKQVIREVLLSKVLRDSSSRPSGPLNAAQFWVSIPRKDPTRGCPVYITRRTRGKPSQPTPIEFRLSDREKRDERALKARNRRATDRRSRDTSIRSPRKRQGASTTKPNVIRKRY